MKKEQGMSLTISNKKHRGECSEQSKLLSLVNFNCVIIFYCCFSHSNCFSIHSF